ncbi:hypothetical protein EBB79_22530 (plasmid) [Parasedimentitalea marina]|uniref:UspA domain-containing protein n=1 Tax=Parasedimentitalea marina TaxID=2483033 RepID=A0A3T0N9N6_9RHOB|nr:universal stress protein [Parasedimentitalea marina]AZV80733.1 hypothetical protein EBB79_22530 [Parasedimentitalea marina]
MKLRFLVPVDVEERLSWIAVLPELQLHAKGNEIELTEVAVVPELGTVIAQAAQAAPLASIVPADLKVRALEVTQEHLDDMTKDSGFSKISRIVRSGNVYSEVLKTAEEVSADMIVLMSNIPGFGNYMLGTNAAKTINHATCSVLVVRPK